MKAVIRLSVVLLLAMLSCGIGALIQRTGRGASLLPPGAPSVILLARRGVGGGIYFHGGIGGQDPGH